MILRSTLLGISLAALGVAACAVDGTSAPSGESAAAPSAASSDAKVLATLTVGHDQTVTFRQIEPGMLTVDEQGAIGEKPVAAYVHGSILDVYRTLAGGVEPPAELVAAEAERATLARTPTARLAPPPASQADQKTAEISKIHAMTGTALDTWFQNTICSNAASTCCIFGNGNELVTGWNWVNSLGNDSYVPNAEAWGLNAGTVASTLGLETWNGSAWVSKTTTALGAGRYNWLRSYTAGYTYWQGYETATGGDIALDTWMYPGPVVSATYYPNGNLVFNGDNFVNDSTVTITAQTGTTEPETIGTYATSSPSATQQGIFGSSAFVRCEPYSPVGTYTATVKATGVQTGESATTTVTVTNCGL